MDSQILFLYEFLFLMWILFFIVHAKILEPARIRRNRYKLYALRDKIYRMVATEELSYHKKGYQELVFINNCAIRKTERLTMINFLISMYEQSKNVDKRVINTEELKELWGEFNFTILEVVGDCNLRNRLVLWLLVALGISVILKNIMHHTFKKAARFIDAYSFYKTQKGTFGVCAA